MKKLLLLLGALLVFAAPAQAATAPITVSAPQWGDRVHHKFLLKGTANVFEAKVHYEAYRWVNGKKTVFIKGSTMATCGTGCRGTYSKYLYFPTAAPRWSYYYLDVFAISPKDGSKLYTKHVFIFYTSWN